MWLEKVFKNLIKTFLKKYYFLSIKKFENWIWFQFWVIVPKNTLIFLWMCENFFDNGIFAFFHGVTNFFQKLFKTLYDFFKRLWNLNSSIFNQFYAKIWSLLKISMFSWFYKSLQKFWTHLKRYIKKWIAKFYHFLFNLSFLSKFYILCKRVKKNCQNSAKNIKILNHFFYYAFF